MQESYSSAVQYGDTISMGTQSVRGHQEYGDTKSIVIQIVQGHQKGPPALGEVISNKTVVTWGDMTDTGHNTGWLAGYSIACTRCTRGCVQ